MPDHVKTHRGLTTEGVVDAALQIADEGGVEAVSIRRLASVLDVTPMAIYRHVRDKGQLLDLMADRLLAQLDLPPVDESTWQEALRRVGASLLAVVEAHPAAPLLLARPFESLAALRVSERMLAILDRAGSRPGRVRAPAAGVDRDDPWAGIHRATYGRAWREQPTDPADGQGGSSALAASEFPYLSRVTDQLMDWSAGPEVDRLTIELWVAGVEALAIQQRRGVRAGRWHAGRRQLGTPNQRRAATRCVLSEGRSHLHEEPRPQPSELHSDVRARRSEGIHVCEHHLSCRADIAQR